MKQGIAFFDFDGTLTRKDSFFEFMPYAVGRMRFSLGLGLHLPLILLYLAKIYHNQKMKERMITHFFKGWSLERFNEICESFCRDKVPQLLRKGALEEIQRLKDLGYVVVIVSASPENWIRGWASHLQIECIATKLESRDGIITGKLEGLNCYGPEKVRRIREKYNLSEFSKVLAYGDTSGDKPMLALAHESHYRPFRTLVKQAIQDARQSR